MNAVWVIFQLIFLLAAGYFVISVVWNFVTENNGGHMVNTSWKINTILATVSFGLAVISGTMVT